MLVGYCFCDVIWPEAKTHRSCVFLLDAGEEAGIQFFAKVSLGCLSFFPP